MDCEPYFKVHNLVSVHPKNNILGQMTVLYMIFHVMVSVYRFVKIWNLPQFPAIFRNGLSPEFRRKQDPWPTFFLFVKLSRCSCAEWKHHNGYIYNAGMQDNYL